MKFVTALFLCILTGAEIDLFVPSFPNLQHVFHLTPFMVEWMLGINLTAQCLTSFVVGNLGDRYGRRSVILYGLSLFIIGSLVCLFANQYWQLLLGRCAQGIGIAAPAVLGYLIIADAYSVERQQYLIGILNSAITLAMALAPVIGSYVNLFFNWQGNFVVLLLLGIVCFLLSMLFIPKSQIKLDIQLSFKAYLPIFQSKRALIYLITICLLIESYWLFISIAPIFYMGDLGISLKAFGFYQGAISIAFALMSLSSSYLLVRFGTKKCFLAGVALIVTFIICMIAFILCDINNAVLITLALQLLAMGVVFPVNILYPISLEIVPNAKGRMAALLNATKWILVSIGIQITSYFYQHRFREIGIALITPLLLSLVSLYFLYTTDQKSIKK